jgi:hypothetical protein
MPIGGIGQDFVVNSTVTVLQSSSSITALADGRFVVTWESGDSGDGSGTCIRGRIFEADGSAVGDDFIVNTTTVNNQWVPSVTALADGRFVVTWLSFDSADGDIRGRVYNADGSPDLTVNAGNDFRVNTETAGYQNAPSVTALADGRFVVTWTSNDNGADFDIRGRVYNADGSPAADDFRINTETASDQTAASVTALADGRFVVM